MRGSDVVASSAGGPPGAAESCLWHSARTADKVTTVDVGIRELEARLSEYVERAAKGQTIRVTDRGKVKAVLGPVPGDLNLDEGIAAGWIRPGEGETPTTWKRFPARRRVRELLDGDRSE
jgi:prevent-host-death family protein